MELYVAGGVGEHGRNCFYVKGNGLCFCVDCGVMADDKVNPYPRLTREQICSLKLVFLTHSHNDHSGAIGFLYENGFNGQIIASMETLRQLNTLRNAIPLESITSGFRGEYMGLNIRWGRSGHCPGSVWYRFEKDGESILFSGDYTESTQLYVCDKIRKMKADTAVIDSAYGNDTATYSGYCRALAKNVSQLLQVHKTLLFPVPKYGRGEELLYLLSKARVNAEYYADDIFLSNLHIPNTFWKKSVKIKIPEVKLFNSFCFRGEQIVFVSDPQLKGHEAQELSKKVISIGGMVIATGTVENDSLVKSLVEIGSAKTMRYPVHQNYTQYQSLVDKNDFKETIAYHCANINK